MISIEHCFFHYRQTFLEDEPIGSFDGHRQSFYAGFSTVLELLKLAGEKDMTDDETAEMLDRLYAESEKFILDQGWKGEDIMP